MISLDSPPPKAKSTSLSPLAAKVLAYHTLWHAGVKKELPGLHHVPRAHPVPPLIVNGRRSSLALANFMAMAKASMPYDPVSM
jgi:hypothetical protein